LNLPAPACIRVGVVVERRKAKSPWAEFLYRPIAVLAGVPAAPAWTTISAEENLTTFYAGDAVIELHRTETTNYRDNLASGAPLLWVTLRPGPGAVAFELFSVTADPAEGEALTGAGNDLVESVPMPDAIQEIVQNFVAEHHVEQSFFKRERDRSASQSPSHPAGGSKDET
jgi:Protein of unknown function (DUF3305)